MRKVLKWIGIVLGVLVGLLVVAVVSLVAISTRQLNKTYDVRAVEIDIPTDAAAISRGAYIYAHSCSDCHGANLAGSAILDDPAIGYLPASNLTSGSGGIGQSYNDYDYVLAIRHGVGKDGKGLMIMPSKAYWYMSDADLAAVIAYIKSSPPVDNQLAAKYFGLMGKVLHGLGAFGETFSAAVIDHDGPRPSAPQAGVSAEYGEYVVNTHGCWECHGENFAGGQSPEPGAPYAANLTPSGSLGSWEVGDFIDVMRTGLTPDGRQIDGNFMPYKEYGRMSDDDLTALFLFLQSLPAMEEN